MPTKRNYGGEQQNYVPKGNEAGGQWGDDETGSNVNWKNPNAKESKLTQGVKKGLGESVGVQVEPTKEKGKNDISKSIDESGANSETKSIFKKAWDSGNETSKNIIDNMPRKISVNIKDKGKSYFNAALDYVNISKNIGGNDGKNQETLFHELGHAVDYMYCEGKIITKVDIWGETSAKVIPSLSFCYKTSNGMTLNETLKKEFKPAVRQQVVSDYRKEIAQINDYEQRRKANAKWSDLSDMYEGAGGNSYGFAGFGHGRSYWKNRDDLRGVEFFAEAFSAKSSSNQERYELIKKYLPNTCKAFEEIYEKLSKADGKVILKTEEEGEQKND